MSVTILLKDLSLAVELIPEGEKPIVLLREDSNGMMKVEKLGNPSWFFPVEKIISTLPMDKVLVCFDGECDTVTRDELADYFSSYIKESYSIKDGILELEDCKVTYLMPLCIDRENKLN